MTESHVGTAGGRERYIREFSRASEAMGHQNELVGDDTALSAFQQSQPFDIVFLHSRKSFSRASDFKRLAPVVLVWAHDYAVVCPAATAWFRFEDRVCGLPPGHECVQNGYLRGCNARRPDRNLKNLASTLRARRGASEAHGVLVASEYVKNRIVLGGVPEERIHVLPYFVPSASASAVSPPDPQDPPRILFVGRFGEEKGIHQLVEAVRFLPESCELVLVGAGHRKAAIEAHARATLGAHRVIFPGELDDLGLEKEYGACSVLVIPSLWPECFGIVGLEALAHQRPVVAFAVGGIAEWLVDEVGVLVDPGDVRGLAVKIRSLLENPEGRRRMGELGRAHVISNFSWERHWTSLQEVVGEAASS